MLPIYPPKTFGNKPVSYMHFLKHVFTVKATMET